ncbi:MAG: hypothetical protein HQK53_17540 [Oligoflexia bacterium]|nr:hypothetical protein [Oligoflexia bacterium]
MFDKNRTFRIIHPFHPWYGKKFILIERKNNCGGDRLFFYDNSDNFVSLPTEWTSMAKEDPFIKISKGRSYFRFQDLLELCELVKTIKARTVEEKKHRQTKKIKEKRKKNKK